MSKKDSRYPNNWEVIALTKKRSVGWRCEECGLKCIDPAFKSDLLLSERKRREMSVHHQDYDPSNNFPDNLIALCSACHLAKHQRGRGNNSPGQLSLF
jgi:5-methylcytosine-specific restriction endonuclease McrA